MRVDWLCMVLVSVSLAGCGEEYRLEALTGTFPFGADAGPGIFGFDGDGNPLYILRGGTRVWRNGQWHEVTGMPSRVCTMRHNPTEGALALSDRMTRWQNGAFVPVSPLFRREDGCTSAVAALEDGTVFLLGTTSGDTRPARSNLFRAQPGGSWAPAFTQTVDLGRPEGAVRDAQCHIWLLGLKGVARVAPDGQSVSVIADCSHPLYEGCQRAIEGNIDESSLMRRAFGSAQWRRIMVLPWDNFHVYLSNQGRVFLVESGSVTEEGVYKLIGD